MDIKVLTLKNRLTIEKTGEQYLDLTAPSFTYLPEAGIKSLHYVLADEAGRIDKICDRYFGNGEYIDAICIVNNIFNPFSVAEGDVLVIPNLNQIDLLYTRPNAATRPSATLSQYVNTDRQSVQDQNRVQRLKKKKKTWC